MSTSQAAVPAQSLVRDITPPSVVRDSNITEMVDLHGIAVFVAVTAHGRELWRSDGSEAGTFLLRDIAPGTDSANPTSLTVAGNHVFFSAYSPGLGNELWRTDGTSNGTILLRDHAPGTDSGAPNVMLGFGAHVYYAATSSAAGTELWRSDGTPAGTSLWTDLQPGAGSSNPSHFAVSGGALFFACSTAGVGNELWRTDGTVANTTLVRDLNPGAADTSFSAMVGGASGVYFVANDGQGAGFDLHFSDGTFARTYLIGNYSTGIPYYDLEPFGNGVLFALDDGQGAGFEPWISDGTPGGTRVLRDIVPGAGSSSPGSFRAISASRAVFRADGPGSGTELWVTDGTTAGTHLLVDLLPGPSSSSPSFPTRAFGGILFAAGNASGGDLHFTDGTAAGTRLVHSFPGQFSNPSAIVPVGNRVFYSARSSAFGYELMVTDGTTTGTRMVADIALPSGDATPRRLHPSGNGVVFHAVSHPLESIYRSDGSTAGTTAIPGSTGISYAFESCVLHDVAYHVGWQPSFGTELLRMDSAGTTLLDLLPGPSSSSPAGLATVNGRLWFGATIGNFGSEPLTSDGTLSGTVSLGDLAPGTGSSSPYGFTACGPNRVVFGAHSGASGREPWVSDGTALGTMRLADIVPGTSGSEPHGFVAAGTQTFFVADHPTLGRELWVTDGTSVGTRVLDVVPGVASSSPSQLVGWMNGTVVFFASEPNVGTGVWRSDGTLVGTWRIGLLDTPGSTPDPRDLVTVGNRAFFTLRDQVHGRELWTTNGATLSLVHDIHAGPADGVQLGSLRARASVGDVMFVGFDRDEGLQLFASDGTAAGTRRVGKIGPWSGSGAAVITMFEEASGAMWFGCDDGLTGLELWRVRSDGVIGSVRPIGAGCSGTAGRVPTIATSGRAALGNGAFGFHVHNGAAMALASLQVSFASADVPIVGSCRLYLGAPIFALPAVTTNATGSAFAPLPIPASAALVGSTLFGQWFVLDPNGELFGVASVSGAIAAHVGY